MVNRGPDGMLTVTVTEFRRRPGAVLREVDAGNPVKITTRGKEPVVLIPYALWVKLTGQADVA